MGARPGRAHEVFAGCVGCPELCPQGYLIFGKDTPQPLNTNLQNFHLGLPQHPGMSCHAQHGAASQTGSTGGARWSRIPSRTSCAKPVQGEISVCQAGMSQPPRSVWAQQIFIGNLFMNWLQAGFTGRGRQGFGAIFGADNEAGDWSLFGSSFAFQCWAEGRSSERCKNSGAVIKKSTGELLSNLC